MPQVPMITAELRKGITEGHPGILRLPVPSPQSFGSQAGAGAQELGGELLKLGVRIQAQEDELALAGKAGDFDVALAKIHRDVLDDPNLKSTDERLKAYKERADAFRGILNEDASNAVQRALSKHAVSRVSKGMIDLTADDYAKRVDQARADLTTQQQRLAEREGLAHASGNYEAENDQYQQRMALLERGQAHGTITAQERAAHEKAGAHAKWETVAQRNPDLMLRLHAGVLAGDGYPAGMDPDKLQHYAQTAHWVIQGRDAEAKRLKAEAKEQKQLEQKVTQDTFLKRMVDGLLTVPEILNSNLEPTGEGSKEHFINVLKAKNEAKAKPIEQDHKLFSNLLTWIKELRITKTDQLDDYFTKSTRDGHGINYEDLIKLRKEFEQLRAPGGELLTDRREMLFKSLKHSITDSNELLGLNDPMGDQNFRDYQEWAIGQLDQARQQGKDPHLLLMKFLNGKENPEYLGRDEAVAPFQSTPQESMARLRTIQKRKERPPMLETQPPSMQRKPGETMAQWRKRTQ